jgi:hypothetical protein
MGPVGLAAIETAKANGTWKGRTGRFAIGARCRSESEGILRRLPALDPPRDLPVDHHGEEAETRSIRIRETVELAARNIRANQCQCVETETKKPGG